MAKYGPKRKIVSLLSFIETGELGQLKRGLTMREVSELLGPPDWWMDGYDPDTSPVPLLWGYSRMLEIHFAYDAPHVVECIKLSRLPSSKQRHLRVRWSFWIRADGIHDEMKISDFLRLPIWEGQKITAGILSNASNVDILTHKVELLRHMWDHDEEALKDIGDSLPTSAYIAQRDRLSTGFHGIYAKAEPRSNRYQSDKWQDFSREAYLAFIDAG